MMISMGIDIGVTDENNPYKNRIMKHEDKELLLKDLCARLPYGVKLYVNITETSFCSSYVNNVKHTKINGAVRLCAIQDNGVRITVPYGTTIFLSNWELEKYEIKPYLRPMNSMIEEEKKKFDDFCVIDEFVFKGDTEIGHKNQAIIMSEGIDYLNSIHVDYRGLIPKGLAIEVTKENNPYEDINFQ